MNKAKNKEISGSYTTQNELIERMRKQVQDYMKENTTLLKKSKLETRLVVTFPDPNKIPLLSQIAIWVINKQKGILDIQFRSTKK